MNQSLGLLTPFFRYKYLLSQLTQREIKARYKQSIIGYAWVVLNPLAQLLVYTFVFSRVLKLNTDIPYPIFVYAGLLPWNLFQGSISIATNSLVENASLIRKVAFPREVIPYSVISAKIIDFLVSITIFFVLFFLYKQSVDISLLLALPIFFFQLLLTTGVSLILSACNLFYRDVQYLVNFVLMLWMYLTPIVYPLSSVPEKYVVFLQLNPMVGIINAYRAVLFHTPIDLAQTAYAAIFSVLIYLLGYVFFKKSEKIFADIA